MFKTKIKVGSYYEFKIKDDYKIAFAVMYGFKDGKNKDVYALMMYHDKITFEFPVNEKLFDKWVDDGQIKEITSDEALEYIL